MVRYGMVTLFIHGISFRYILQSSIENYLTKLESKIKTKIIKMKRKCFSRRCGVIKVKGSPMS